jgi:hypothetical protein
LIELATVTGRIIIVFLFFLLLDLINSAVGNNADKEKKLALTLLHNVIGAKKKGGVWTKAYELVMKRHLELCVDLKDHRMAKDGLHQYRNLCQLVKINRLHDYL